MQKFQPENSRETFSKCVSKSPDLCVMQPTKRGQNVIYIQQFSHNNSQTMFYGKKFFRQRDLAPVFYQNDFLAFFTRMHTKAVSVPSNSELYLFAPWFCTKMNYIFGRQYNLQPRSVYIGIYVFFVVFFSEIK